jgi:hypothetical protein
MSKNVSGSRMGVTLVGGQSANSILHKSSAKMGRAKTLRNAKLAKKNKSGAQRRQETQSSQRRIKDLSLMVRGVVLGIFRLLLPLLVSSKTQLMAEIKLRFALSLI